MNIGLSRALFFFLLFYLSSSFCEETVKNNSLVFELSPGFSISSEKNSFIAINRPDREALGLAVRVLWRPEHLLRLGIESGIIKISSVSDKNIPSEFGDTKVKFGLNAVPVLLFADMLIDKLEISAGTGYYYLFSNLVAFDDKSSSYSWDLGYNLTLAYNSFFLGKFILSPEIKYFIITTDNQSIISFNIKGSYSFFSW